jgi:hypothetical protein
MAVYERATGGVEAKDRFEVRLPFSLPPPLLAEKVC